MNTFETKLKLSPFIFWVKTLLRFNLQHKFFNMEHYHDLKKKTTGEWEIDLKEPLVDMFW